jgi:hypothetical protein
MASSFLHCSALVLFTAAIVFAQPEHKPIRRGYADSIFSLNSQHIEGFILWASRVDSAKHLNVREAIWRARGDSTVLPPLFGQLEQTRTTDVGKSLIILGIIGELKNPLSMKRLESIINEPLPNGDDTNPRLLRQRETVEILQSKAVEALAYLQTPASDTLVIRVIKNHPSKAVRSMAIDSYLYNRGDTEAAKAQLRMDLESKEETKHLVPLVDRVRRTEAIDPETFRKGIENFYARHPEQLAQQSVAVAISEADSFRSNFLWLSFILFIVMLITIFLIYFILKKYKLR